ncbi:MAG: transglycosylase domain-containing protein [Solirubrobacteraceae bacterium]
MQIDPMTDREHGQPAPLAPRSDHRGRRIPVRSVLEASRAHALRLRTRPPGTGPRSEQTEGPPSPPPQDPHDGRRAAQVPPLPPVRRKMKKLRLTSIALAALALGLISFIYGMFMAVASDLPKLEDRYQFTHAKNSVLFDDQGRPLGVLSEQHRILLSPSQIPRVVKDAVISVEDKRFYSEPGIDPRGILRAAVDDVLGRGGVQGASTITEQFVKNALEAQARRTIFEKLREAALAYQLAHKWPKEKILAEYLNAIYFGEGAYGIEAAAETYFGHEPGHEGCGLPGAPLCVSDLSPAEAATLAGIIASPSAFDPVINPHAALARRSLVLKDMLTQRLLTSAEYEHAMAQPLPSPQSVQPPGVPPVEGLQTGYFTTWVEQQLIERYGATRALEGGLTVHTTLDLGLQRAAEAAVNNYLPGPSGPTASLVAIENSTGDVRAMVGGHDYASAPFNLATASERQPGSAFKAFDLATALDHGVSPYSTWLSAPKVFTVPGTGGHEKFYVHNDNNAYVNGPRTLIEATAYSDNSVFAEMGIQVGTGKIAAMAHRMGIETPVSTNPAMTIGGLEVGVSPLEMAHAYETIAEGGQRVGSSLIAGHEPTGIQEVVAQPGQVLRHGNSREVNRVRLSRVFPASVASEETTMLETVIQYGTARAAAIGQFAAGKTGTTTNFGDAWFVGWNHKYTVAVWVGFPDHLIPMTTEFNGGPVEGGTFPALIWHDFMTGSIQLEQERALAGTHTASSGGETGAGGPSVAPSGASGTEREAQAGGGHATPGTQHATPGPKAGGEGGAAQPSAPSAPSTPTAPSAPSAPSTPPAPGAAGEEGAGGAGSGGGSGGGSSGGGGGTPSSTGGASPGG